MAMVPVADAALLPGRDGGQPEHVGFAGEAAAQLVTPRPRRGRPPVADPKPKVTIRLPRTTLEALRQSGRGWQTRLARLAGEMVAAEQCAGTEGATAAPRLQVVDGAASGACGQDGGQRKS